MTTEEMFAAAEGVYLQFGGVENPRHPCPDICALLMLYTLHPVAGDMITNAEQDKFRFAPTGQDLAGKLTQEIVDDLVRCGVIYDAEYDGFTAFV